MPRHAMPPPPVRLVERRTGALVPEPPDGPPAAPQAPLTGAQLAAVAASAAAVLVLAGFIAAGTVIGRALRSGGPR